MTEIIRNIFGEEIKMPKVSRTGRKTTRPKGYALAPGTGPAGKTCGDCAHKERHQAGKVWYKCALFASKTGGRGTDILVSSAACRLFQPQTEDTK